MIESPCKLADHAYVCLADDRLVFADVRHDRYQCLDRRNTQRALQLFDGIRSADIAYFPDTTQEQTRLIVRSLTIAGLLTNEAIGGKAVIPIAVVAPNKTLESHRIFAAPRFGHRLSFLRAAVTASAKLRLQSFRRILRNVKSRKNRHGDLRRQNLQSMRELTAIFHRLRPFYVREYVCRFDSLALIEFLAHYRQFPDWIFGVTSEPFSAHCWVQDGDCVLNDTVDFVRRYTPIMAF